MMQKDIFIIVTNTPSVVSGIIGHFTHTPYNHVSVSLDAEMDKMYSFGRRYKYFPWIGGFVKESPVAGTLGRFPQTQAIILTTKVDEETYNELSEKLSEMLANKRKYHYDSIGMIMAIFGKVFRRNNYYYCSEFVRELLVDYGIRSDEEFKKIVRPADFIELADFNEIYRGRLVEFREKVQARQNT